MIFLIKAISYFILKYPYTSIAIFLKTSWKGIILPQIYNPFRYYTKSKLIFSYLLTDKNNFIFTLSLKNI